MAELRLRGRPASPGLAVGAIAVLPEAGATPACQGGGVSEAAQLGAAIAAATAELRDLVAELDAAAADVISFQVAMLDDPALAEPAFAMIEAGSSAAEAWRAALDDEIAGYEAADDEYFRARAADLADLRDRVLDALSGGARLDVAAGSVIVARDLAPSRFLGVDWSRGGAILLSQGSPTSHVAMLARARGVPMIVGLGVDVAGLSGAAVVDAAAGEAVLDPEPATVAAFERRRHAEAEAAELAARHVALPARTADGTDIAVMINVASPTEIDGLDPATCDGIGLVRTEFLFPADGRLPGEEAQYRIYRRLAEWAEGRPVTIRTLDAGGDKPIPGLTIDGESNPFLGVRGLRLSLTRPEVFRVQLRAICRAAVHGAIKVMLPMVTAPAELMAAREMLENEMASLAAAGVPARMPPLGIMVEVPATAIAIDLFDADFFSIGSNDLVQYVTAAGRDIGAVADLADPRHPAVQRLFATVAAHGAATGREVSLCGDAAADPALTAMLLAKGLRTLSVAPAAIGRLKAAIAGVALGETPAGAL